MLFHIPPRGGTFGSDIGGPNSLRTRGSRPVGWNETADGMHGCDHAEFPETRNIREIDRLDVLHPVPPTARRHRIRREILKSIQRHPDGPIAERSVP